SEDSGGSVVSKRVTDEIVQQSESELRKSKRQRTPKDFGPEFQLYLIEGTRDEISDQYSYYFNVEYDPKTFDEATKFQDGLNQKSGIEYFATYAPVARISTIRLLIAMASIHNLIIHQMDVKIAFLNGDMEEDVYMNQPLGFNMPSNKNKVCKLIKSLYGLKQAPKKWHQKFDEVVLSNGYLLNQANKYVYIKFDASGKRVIICLYVDDMLIFGTDQVQVDMTKEFLSSRFFMKDMGEEDVILVSTPLDTCEKLMPNRGLAVSQPEYFRVIVCLLYAMTCTMPYIAFTVRKLSRLVYSGYPLVLEGYTDASWISNTEDISSTIGWVFLLGGAAGKEVEWLKNLLLEIPLWVKPMAPISICCDSAATLAKAYSQMYNGKSRHLGVRNIMIRELITNEVVSIEFVKSQQDLAHHLTKVVAVNIHQRVDDFSFVTHRVTVRIVYHISLTWLSFVHHSKDMTIIRSGMTPEAIKELIAQRVAEALPNYEATCADNALEAKSQSQNSNDSDNENGGNRNGRNGNGNHGDRGNNRNGNPNENGRGVMPVAHV
nr:hypothetical protein [Tanacetum cinerariifolium]